MRFDDYRFEARKKNLDGSTNKIQVNQIYID